VSDEKPVELRVSVDVGYRRHSVAIGLPSGEVLEEFEIAHRPEGFAEFFSRIERHQKARDCEVAVAGKRGSQAAYPATRQSTDRKRCAAGCTMPAGGMAEDHRLLGNSSASIAARSPECDKSSMTMPNWFIRSIASCQGIA